MHTRRGVALPKCEALDRIGGFTFAANSDTSVAHTLDAARDAAGDIAGIALAEDARSCRGRGPHSGSEPAHPDDALTVARSSLTVIPELPTKARIDATDGSAS